MSQENEHPCLSNLSYFYKSLTALLSASTLESLEVDCFKDEDDSLLNMFD